MPIEHDPNLFCPPPADAVPSPTTQPQEPVMLSATNNGVTVYFRTPNGMYEYVEWSGVRYEIGCHDFMAAVYHFLGKSWNGTAW